MKRKYFEYALLLLAIVALLGLINAIRAGATEGPTHDYPLAADEKVSLPTASELLTLTNERRAKAGSPPLLMNDRLNLSARTKANEIVTTGVYEHQGKGGKQGLDYIPATELGCLTIAENLAAETTSQRTIADWMGSQAHREAMLDNRYDIVGFGMSQGTGWHYVVGHYCDLP